MAQPVWVGQKPQHKRVLAHVWVPLEPPQVLVAYLTQRGSRLNKPQRAVLARIKTLWQQAKLAYKALVM